VISSSIEKIVDPVVSTTQQAPLVADVIPDIFSIHKESIDEKLESLTCKI
jgi:hypothetical protein